MAEKRLFRKWNVKGKTMLPVHVGAGQENTVDPLEYVVKDGMFYRVDIEGMLKSDQDFAEKFVKASESRDQILSLKKCIHDSFNPSIREQWVHRAHVSKSFNDMYKKKLFDLNNQLLVHCLPFSGTAYIPGSSIKGAIRTAVLDELAREKGYKNVNAKLNNEAEIRRLKGNKLANMAESIVCLGTGNMKPDNDPFRFIKVTDAKLPPDSTEIVMVRNTVTEGRKAGPMGIDMFVEVVKENVDFEFQISIASKEYMQDKNEVLSKFRNISWIIAATFNYLIDEPGNLIKESEKYYDGKNVRASNAIDRIIDDYNSQMNRENITYLRVGRFSHLECMTFSDRPASPMDTGMHLCRMNETTHKKGYGKTRNLIDGTVPLGVIRCEINKG